MIFDVEILEGTIIMFVDLVIYFNDIRLSNGWRAGDGQ